MKIQLALDRFTISNAIKIAEEVRDYVKYIEVGTSLIKEFGMKSVKELRKAFPEKIIVADIKTFDNAKYEFEMCFNAGADIATVMGTAPKISIDNCIKVAERMDKQVMIDLLNTSKEQMKELCEYGNAIFCLHVSKDMQEFAGTKQKVENLEIPEILQNIKNVRLAMAGGIDYKFLKGMKKSNAEMAIVGSAITQAENKLEAARKINGIVSKIEEDK